MPAAIHSSRRARRVVSGYFVIEDRFDVDPRRAGHEPDQDPPEAQPVRSSRPVTAQRVRPIGRREQRLEGLPEDINHFPFERAHDDEEPPQVVGWWGAPASKPGHHDDRWMVPALQRLPPIRASPKLLRHARG